MSSTPNMRAILTRIPVGDDPLTCGACPFRSPNYGGDDRSAVWLCTHPLLGDGGSAAELDGGRRTDACLAAEAEAEAGIR